MDQLDFSTGREGLAQLDTGKMTAGATRDSQSIVLEQETGFCKNADEDWVTSLGCRMLTNGAQRRLVAGAIGPWGEQQVAPWNCP